MKKIFTFKILVKTYYPKSEEKKLAKAPDHCVENILNFARAYDAAESKAIGTIEMMMN